MNAVCPGTIDNDMFDALVHKFALVAGIDEEALTSVFQERAPLKRKGTSEEIANLNLFLASDDSSSITGAAYVADGVLPLESCSQVLRAGSTGTGSRPDAVS